MGLFSKHKDKTEKENKSRPDLLNPTPTAPPPTSHTPAPAQQPSHNNSYHDSTYYSSAGSNISSEEPRVQQQKPPGQAPGTTVTITTTTTTTTTTVTSDGTTYTSSHPYNPATDPPVKTRETIVNDKDGASIPSATSTNPNSTTNVPQASQSLDAEPGNNAQNNLQAGQSAGIRPQVQRMVSPGRKPTPQEMESNSKLNLIPPTPPIASTPAIPVPSSPTTSGGRTIPPRSELRHSPNANKGYFGNNGSNNGDSRKNSLGSIDPNNPGFLNDDPVSPGPPMRSEKRNSIDRGLNVAPLRTSGHSPRNSSDIPVSTGGAGGDWNDHQQQPGYAPPDVPPKDSHFIPSTTGQGNQYGHPQNQGVNNMQDIPGEGYQNGQQNYVPTAGPSDPLSYGHEPHGGAHTPNSFHPGPSGHSNASSTFDAPPTSAEAMYTPPPPEPKLSHRQSLSSALKGFQGASEVLRGSINSGIARGTHDKAEQERMRVIREQGLRDWKESGLQERVRSSRDGMKEKQDERRRLRKRSLSRGVHGTEGPGGLEAVEERSI